MKHGYTIVYVANVVRTLEFYRDAFGFNIRFVHESKAYGELKTGGTVLTFASHELGKTNLDGGHLRGKIKDKLFGLELEFVTEDVEASVKAIACGALAI